MQLDARSLIQFVAVAEEMSFTRAAQRLSIAQPWLSKRMALLEEALGFRLLERTTRRIDLTPAGHAFLLAAREVAQGVQRAEHLARTLARDERHTLRIGVPPYGGRLAVRNSILARFAQDQPAVALELDIGWTPGLLEKVTRGDLDGAFGIGWDDAAGLHRQPLTMLAVNLKISEEDPLAGSEQVELSSLIGRRIAVFMRGLYPGLYDRVMAPMAQAGGDLIQVPEMRESSIARSAGPTPLMIAGFGRVGVQPHKSVVSVVGLPPVPFSFFTAKFNRGPALSALVSLAGELAQPDMFVV